jgi:two-component sensor histidine kinase
MDAERLAPLGIVLNELLTNSIKHAFGECPEPRIEVEGRLSGTDLILVYRDNGRGLPEGSPPEGNAGFGLQLIAGLVAQLNGTIQAESDGGARYTMRIPA